MAKRRVVVTGLGIVSPVGIGVAEAWANIIAGNSGIARITRFDVNAFPTQIAGEVKGFDASRWESRGSEYARMGRHSLFALEAADEALGRFAEYLQRLDGERYRAVREDLDCLVRFAKQEKWPKQLVVTIQSFLEDFGIGGENEA